MRTAKWIVGLSMVGAATVALAQQRVDPPTSATTANMTMKQHCMGLAKQFDAADVKHVEASKLAAAKKHADHGRDLCKTDPKRGVQDLDSALRDIGVTSK
jgi:hypothetical protein